ncbi:RNA polymerase II transcriptional coactivator KELP [Linum perenne]
MEPEILSKIRSTVVDILKDADMNTATEFKVRVLASMRLGMDLSDIEHKKFVRGVVESYLLKSTDDAAAGIEGKAVEAEVQRETAEKKEVEVDNYGNRYLCKLSNRRNVTVHDYMGKSLVSIRDYYLRNGLELPSSKGISLTTEQWSVLRKSFGDIDSAITVMQSRLGSDLDCSPMDKCNPVSETLHEQSSHHDEVVAKPTELQSEKDGNGVTNSTPAELQSERVSNVATTTTTACDEIPDRTFPSASCRPVSNPDIASTLEVDGYSPIAASAEEDVARISVERFDGKNYKSWVRDMELFLKQLKVAHVLSGDPPLGRAAEKKWRDDDHMCRFYVLNSLCDSLYHQFSKTTKTAKELWDQLNQVYLFEEFGSKRAQVKEYIEFQIVEDRSIFDQVHQLNSIADAIVVAGTVVQEFFHVSTVIAKLPPSWKSFCNKLAHLEHLPFMMLMDMIKAEEDSRKRNKLGESPAPSHNHNHNHNHHHVMNVAPRTREVNRPPSMQWKRHETDTEVERWNRTQLCYCCGRKGHTVKQCPDRRLDNEAYERHRHTMASARWE